MVNSNIKNKYNFILASASPRRRDLLAQIGYAASDIIAPDIDEASMKNEKPHHYVVRIARAKANHVALTHNGRYIIACDTIIEKNSQILHKTTCPAQAAGHLKQLSGGRHRAYSAVCCVMPNGHVVEKLVMSRVKFKHLNAKEITHYIATDEWVNKAGSYAIQGIAGAFVAWINGSYSNIVGLPLHETYNILQQCNMDIT